MGTRSFRYAGGSHGNERSGTGAPHSSMPRRAAARYRQEWVRSPAGLAASTQHASTRIAAQCAVVPRTYCTSPPTQRGNGAVRRNRPPRRESRPASRPRACVVRPTERAGRERPVHAAFEVRFRFERCVTFDLNAACDADGPRCFRSLDPPQQHPPRPLHIKNSSWKTRSRLCIFEYAYSNMHLNKFIIIILGQLAA